MVWSSGVSLKYKASPHPEGAKAVISQSYKPQPPTAQSCVLSSFQKMRFSWWEKVPFKYSRISHNSKQQVGLVTQNCKRRYMVKESDYNIQFPNRDTSETGEWQWLYGTTGGPAGLRHMDHNTTPTLRRAHEVRRVCPILALWSPLSMTKLRSSQWIEPCFMVRAATSDDFLSSWITSFSNGFEYLGIERNLKGCDWSVYTLSIKSQPCSFNKLLWSIRDNWRTN